MTNTLGYQKTLRRTSVVLTILTLRVAHLGGQDLSPSLQDAKAPRYTVFNPATDCAPLPRLIRDAARDAGLDVRSVCYVNDRQALASKAGEMMARRLDRTGSMVRVVIPFGHLLVVNGTELGVRIAARFYDSETERRMKAMRFEWDSYRAGEPTAAYEAVQALRQVRRFYAAELADSINRTKLEYQNQQ